MGKTRYYAESDGGGMYGGPGTWSFYVIDRYGSPWEGHDRTEVCTDRHYSRPVGMRIARKIAAEMNENPPYPIWDDVQARRDNYPTGQSNDVTDMSQTS